MKLAEAEKVDAWVLEQYLRLGFTPEQSETLSERGVDHHTAARFLANGCTHELVVRIRV